MLRIRPNPWTDEQTAKARELLAAKAPNETFIAEIGRSKVAARARIRYLGDPEGFKSKRRAERPSRAKTASKRVENPDRFYIPDEVIAAAAARLTAHRSLTAQLCGDPPVGFSALDRRQAEASI
jgi:hypothetical protein